MMHSLPVSHGVHGNGHVTRLLRAVVQIAVILRKEVHVMDDVAVVWAGHKLSLMETDVSQHSTVE